jgi:hypothetical protein
VNGKGKRESKKEEKKKKKNNGIKKPLSAYMLYNNNRRPMLRDEYPGKYYTLILTFQFPDCWSVQLLPLLPD